MCTKKWLIMVLMFLVLIIETYAATQSTPYVLTDFPISLIGQDSAIWIKWTGATRNPLNADLLPDSGTIYYGKSPGGSVIKNYTDSIVKRVDSIIVIGKDTSRIAQNNILFKTGKMPQRGSKFRPSQNGMEAGVYYLMVAFKTKIGLKDTTFYSNEIQLILEAKTGVELQYPVSGSTITELTPTFQWKKVAGVPYYHVLVSDEEIKPDLDNNSIQGLSIVWEAITSNGQMTYGAPDPSGTISTDPPPMSPGKEYSWIVLNNYGNHPAFSSTKAFSLPSKFSLKGDTLKRPVNIWKYGKTITSDTVKTVTLRWRNLDAKANTYKIYLYVASNIDKIGAQMVVWSKEVTAQQFTKDTGLVSFDAKSILTDNYYTWKVMAIDAKGASTSGDTTGFQYRTPSGNLRVETMENIVSGGQTITNKVGLAEIKVEVLDGSMEAPLLFYTDNNGVLERKRPAGTYNLTAIKNGYEIQSKSVTVADQSNQTVIFYLKRPDATVYGKVVDKSNQPVDLALVKGVSERGDTVKVSTDPIGNFVVNCYEADWRFSVTKEGFEPSLPKDTTVLFGQSINIGNALTLKKNPFVLSGKIVNQKNEPLLGVNVKVYLESKLVGEIPSTPQEGAFSFALDAGTYTIFATKVGFTTYKKSMALLSSQSMTISMSAGAALITGSIIGRSYNNLFKPIFSPITNATVMLIDTTSMPKETLVVYSDAVYGTYSASVGGDKTYTLYASSAGFAAKTGIQKTISVDGGKTYTIQDTLGTLARLKGFLRITDSVSTKLQGVTVNVIDTVLKKIVATTKSDALGSFELVNIPENSVYRIGLGRAGYITDTIKLTDSAGLAILTDNIAVRDGKPVRIDNGYPVTTVFGTMERGEKTLSWKVMHNGAEISSVAIKLKSPIEKTFTTGQSLEGVGPGDYILGADVKALTPSADTFINCAYHVYTMPDEVDSFYVDTLQMPAVFAPADSMMLTGGTVSFSVKVIGIRLDSGFIYYKDANASVFSRATYTNLGGTVYSFTITPQKDGSSMEYYFQLYAKKDVYGYKQKTYRTFIKPNPHLLSRIAIVPQRNDTILLPADGSMTFSFNGFYSTTFSQATGLTNDNVVWSLVNSSGCKISVKDSSVPSAVLTTPSGGTGAEINAVKAVFKTANNYTLAPGVADSAKIYFKVDRRKLSRIRITYVNDDGRGFITTSSSERAVFNAVGILDSKERATDSVVAITPVWEIEPVTAGTITGGVFKPADNFFGRVRILAGVGSVIGDYTDGASKLSGLAVNYIMTQNLDTIWNGTECSVVIPAGVIGTRTQALLAMEKPVLKNTIYDGSILSTLDTLKFKNRVFGKFDQIGNSFAIQDVDSAISIGAKGVDSIVLSIEVPEDMRDAAAGSPGKFFIGLWNEKYAKWLPVENTKISTDGGVASAKITHFSMYSLLRKASETGVKVTIKPNPFSPYVKPVAEYKTRAFYGTCFLLEPETPDRDGNVTVEMDIYNVVGEKVWSASLLNARSGNSYRVWWDGRSNLNTTPLGSAQHVDSKDENTFYLQGSSLCKNGRYFLVVAAKDSKNYKKSLHQIIIFK